MWIIYTDPVDAAEAAARVSRHYVRSAALGGSLVDVSAGELTPADQPADAELGAFAYVLPGRRAGAVVTDGQTERWALPRQTAAGAWALPLPDGWMAADVPGLPAGGVSQDDEPAFPANAPLGGDEPPLDTSVIQTQGQANQVLVRLFGNAAQARTVAVTHDGDVYQINGDADRARIAGRGLIVRAERAGRARGGV
jgi:hypothetical protein